jgi:hypothetical protein
MFELTVSNIFAVTAHLNIYVVGSGDFVSFKEVRTFKLSVLWLETTFYTHTEEQFLWVAQLTLSTTKYLEHSDGEP